MNDDTQARLILTIVFFVGMIVGFAAGVNL